MIDPRVLELLAPLGVDVDPVIDVRLTGADPVLATPYPIGAASGAAMAAVATVAAQVWHDATGQGQEVVVDVPQSAESLISFLLQRVDGPLELRSDGMAETTKLYEARDGRWIHLHGGFPHLAAGTIEVLGCELDGDAIAEAVSERDAFELEEALAAAGMCGAVARTRDEWLAHPQHDAIAPLGQVVVRKIAEGDPLPATDGARPFGGVRALDLTRLLAGPTCGRTLAEHGADVLLINSLQLDNIDPFVIDTSHGKRSAVLDLDDPAGADQLRALVHEADVFVQGYRGGSMERRGFGAHALADGHRGLIHVSVNCYGPVGPWKDRPGWEQLAQSTTGMVLGHSQGGRPEIVPGAVCDYTTGYLAALGAAVALRRRAEEGGSYAVEASLCQTAEWVGGMELVDPTASAGVPGTAPLETASEWGTITHLPPVPQLSVTPARWARPPARIGSHPAAFSSDGFRSRRRPSRARGCGACRACCGWCGAGRRAGRRSW